MLFNGDGAKMHLSILNIYKVGTKGIKEVGFIFGSEKFLSKSELHKGKILTKDVLKVSYLLLVLFVSQQNESINHLFIQCSMVKPIFNWWFFKFHNCVFHCLQQYARVLGVYLV